MITRKQLIDATISCWEADNEEEVIEYITSLNKTFDYEDITNAIQMIITELELSFYIAELSSYWAIAYYEYYEDWEYGIIHIGNPNMTYNSIEELVDELNKFEHKYRINNYIWI